MGMYDTIVFQKPIICQCGHKLESSQVKAFDSLLDIYRVGDMIPSAPMFALLEEVDYCDNCSATIEFFVACSYGVYLGVFQSYHEAKETINSFGMEELLKFYATRVPPRRSLFDRSPIGFMERLVEFYESPSPREEGWFSPLLARDNFTEATPLEAIKNYLKEDELAREIKRLYAERLTFDITYKMVDEKSAEVYSQKVQSALGRDALFSVVKIVDRAESVADEEGRLVTYSDLSEGVIVNRVQVWLDEKGIFLQVVCGDV